MYVSTCFAVSIESLEASLSRRIANVLKESLRRNRPFLSLLPFSQSSHLSLPRRLFLESMRERGLLLKGERAKKIASESGRHTHRHTDTSSSRCALYIVRDNRYACLSHTACIHIHTHTYAHACRCIYKNKPSLLSESFDESGPRSAHFLYAFVASSLWDGPQRERGSLNTCVLILWRDLDDIHKWISHKFHIFLIKRLAPVNWDKKYSNNNNFKYFLLSFCSKASYLSYHFN